MFDYVVVREVLYYCRLHTWVQVGTPTVWPIPAAKLRVNAVLRFGPWKTFALRND